jgi:hypothetical protein
MGVKIEVVSVRSPKMTHKS